MSYVSLADLIGSRLCHDLINPLGAIGNGVELIDMTGSAKGPEMDLIRDAVRDAQARIRFFRIAFGAAGPTQTISARETRTAIADVYGASRLKPEWTVAADLPRTQAKLAFLMVLCAETALPMGGSLTMSVDAQAHWQLSARSDRITMDDALWSVLRFGPNAAGRALRPSEVQFAALHAAAEDMDLTVNYVVDGDRLSMSTA